jgi:hypothetical protein
VTLGLASKVNLVEKNDRDRLKQADGYSKYPGITRGACIVGDIAMHE